jgi:hypothetical protein
LNADFAVWSVETDSACSEDGRGGQAESLICQRVLSVERGLRGAIVERGTRRPEARAKYEEALLYAEHSAR